MMNSWVRRLSIAVAVSTSVLLAGCVGTASLDGAEASGEQEETTLVGTWVGGPQDAYVQLNDDGTLVGFDGCNNFGGIWSNTGEGIDFGDIAVELVACDKDDAVMAQATTAHLEGSDLVLVDPSGTELLQLTRQ
jgi:heat shock protein HslJ